MTPSPQLPVIDADAHVVEPFSMWIERIPARLHDLVLRREPLDDGSELLHGDGKTAHVEWSTGTLATPGAVWADGRLDIDIDTECDSGVYDPTRRLQVMDEQGIAVSVLFPSMMLGLCDVRSVDLQAHYAIAYNGWIRDFCAVDPVRLRWGAVLPTSDLELSVLLAQQAIDQGAAAIMVPPVLDRTSLSLGDPSLDRLYSVLEEAERPLVVHAVNPANSCLQVGHLWRSRTQWQMGYSLQGQLALLHLIESGTLERHPKLRVGLFEGDVGWIRHWVGRLELTFKRLALVSRTLGRPVLEQFLSQCVVSGDMSDPCLADAVEFAGADRVLFASDWPHHDGTWPDPIVAVRDHPGLTPAQRVGVLVHGPAAFYGIDLLDLVDPADTRWSLDADPADLGGLLPNGRNPALLRGSSRQEVSQ